jgi:hypothetical protein
MSSLEYIAITIMKITFCEMCGEYIGREERKISGFSKELPMVTCDIYKV